MHVRAPKLGRERKSAHHEALALPWKFETCFDALSHHWAGLVRQAGKGCAEGAVDNARS